MSASAVAGHCLMAGMSDHSQRRGAGLLSRMFGGNRASRAPQNNDQIDEWLYRRCPDCGQPVYHIAPRCRHCGVAIPSGRVA
jgi:Rubredoxin-like zinc ribbon domain (DUF35_N)